MVSPVCDGILSDIVTVSISAAFISNGITYSKSLP